LSWADSRAALVSASARRAPLILGKAKTLSSELKSCPFKFASFSKAHEELEHRYDDVWDIEGRRAPIDT
jgi:hypothetical protein